VHVEWCQEALPPADEHENNRKEEKDRASWYYTALADKDDEEGALTALHGRVTGPPPRQMAQS